MKYLRTYEDVVKVDDIIKDRLDKLMEEIVSYNLKIVKSKMLGNNHYLINWGEYKYDFSRLTKAIPVNSKYTGDGYDYVFTIYRNILDKKGNFKRSEFVLRNNIDKKYWNEIINFYNIQQNVGKYNL